MTPILEFQIIASILLIGAPTSLWVNAIEMTAMQGYHMVMLITGLAELAAGGILYAVTWLNLKKRLNLA